MTTAQLTGLVSGLTALVAAIGAIVAQFRHVNGPAHQQPPGGQPPATPPAS